MRCKNCDEVSIEKYCTFCKENNPTRCKWCGVILEDGKVCSFCELNPPNVLDYCVKCGESKGYDNKTFKRNGNWCGKCLAKLNRKLRGYDGHQEYDEWLLEQSNK